MLLNSVTASLDDKGRIVLPSAFRDHLHGPLFFALGDENEIAIWPEEAFNVKMAQKQERELTGGAEGAKELRRFAANAAPVKLDTQFRVSIPEALRKRAGVEAGRPVTIIGANNRIEIWDKARLDTYFDDEVA
jgi:MraZ protein